MTSDPIRFGLLGYHLYMKHQGYKDFFRRFPFCLPYKTWVIIFDHISYVLDPYIWLTIANDEWLTRNDAAARREE
jgi:hypothetical protein